MMKLGGADKRNELVKAFGELSISTSKKRELTEHEKKVARQGDLGQGERLAHARR